jgi:cell division protein ZapA
MAQINLPIGGFHYPVSCRDGEEAHLTRLGESVAQKVSEARAAVGNPGEVRQLLLAALLFADENNDLRSQSQVVPQVSPPLNAPEDNSAMTALVERLERIASLLENSVDSA